MYITESLCYTPETNTALLTNYTPIYKMKINSTITYNKEINTHLGN